MKSLRILGICILVSLSTLNVQAIDIPIFGKTRKAIINGEVVRVRRAVIIMKVNPDVRLSTFDTPWVRRQVDQLSVAIPGLKFLRAERLFAPPSYLKIKYADATPLLRQPLLSDPGITGPLLANR